MDAKAIIERKFEMALRGYKTEEVDEFHREVSLGFSRLQKENEDLEKKLEVLAERIKEYRAEEDTLKDALLGAQRQGNALIADSKRKAAEIVEDAQSNSDSILKKAEEDRQKLQVRGENEIAAAQAKAQEIIDTANKEAADIENEMNLRTDVQKEILHRTTKEINEFKNRIVESYKLNMETINNTYKAHTETINSAYNNHIDSVEKIAGDCENEFIKTTRKEYTGEPKLKDASENRQSKKNRKNKNEPETKQKGAGNSAGESIDIRNPDSTIQFEMQVEDDFSEKEVMTEYASQVYDEIFSDDEVIEMNLDSVNTADTGEVPLFKPKSDNKKTSEIFFNKNKEKSKQKF
jgi:cell division septum initiation protein DivIVA